MNSDDITLRQESYGSLTTAGVPLTAKQFDDNNIAIYKDFESLAITLGVPAYDAGTTYNNDYNDNATETFATYGNRFWQWINVSDGNSTPAEGSDWTQIFPTMLAHEKNKDNRLTHPNGNFEITLSDEDIAGEEVPRAAIKAVDSLGVNYFVSVQDTTNLGEGFEVDIGAVSDDGTGLSVEINSTTATISHKTTGTTTNGITIENGKIRIRTPQQIAGNLSNGDVLQFVDASTGEVEGVNPSAGIVKIGFVDYNDLATQTTPISFVASTPIVLTNDKLGAFTNTAYLPSGVTNIFASNQFDWSELGLGDMIDIRLDVEVTTTSPSQNVDIDLYLGIGSPGGEYPIPFVRSTYKNAGVHGVNRYNGIYMGNSDTLNYPAEFRLVSDGGGSVKINGWYSKIIKNS